MTTSPGRATITAIVTEWRRAANQGSTIAGIYVRLIDGAGSPQDAERLTLELVAALPKAFGEVSDLINITGAILDPDEAATPTAGDVDDELEPYGDTPGLDVLALLAAAEAPSEPEEAREPLERLTYPWEALAELLAEVNPHTIASSDLTIAQLESVEDLMLTVGLWHTEAGERPLTALARRWLSAEHPDRWRTDPMLTEDLRTFTQRVMLKAWTETNDHPKLAEARERLGIDLEEEPTP